MLQALSLFMTWQPEDEVSGVTLTFLGTHWFVLLTKLCLI